MARFPRKTVIVPVVALVMLAAVLAMPGEAGAAGGIVTIEHFQFAPSPVTITVGSSVTWVNRDPVDHTVSPMGGAFSGSGVLKPGGSFRAVFPKAGMFSYYDSFNNFMTGTVIVVGAPKATARPTVRPVVTPRSVGTVRPTPMPAGTSKPTPRASASAGPVRNVAPSQGAGGAAGGAGSPGGAASPGGSIAPGGGSGGAGPTTGSSGSSDGLGGLGLLILVLVLVGAAFVAGLLVALRRGAWMRGGVPEGGMFGGVDAAARPTQLGASGRATPVGRRDAVQDGVAVTSARRVGAKAPVSPSDGAPVTKPPPPSDVAEDAPIESARSADQPEA